MQLIRKNTIVILFSLTLLLVVPGITFSDVFAEKLIISNGQEEAAAQFSIFDEFADFDQELFGYVETRILGDDNILVLDGEVQSSLFLDGIDFTKMV